MRNTRGPESVRAGAALAVGLVAVPGLMLSTPRPMPAPAPAHPPMPASATRTPVPMPKMPVPKVVAPKPAELPPGTGLSISVGDGRTTAGVGEQLAYVISVRNEAGTTTSPLKITLTPAYGVQVVSANDHGVLTSGLVTWHAVLPAGATGSYRVTARVARTQPRELRLAAVACASAASGRPTVCAAHLDLLPAGAAALAAAHAAAAPPSSTMKVLAYAGGALAVLVAAVLAVFAARRTRPRRGGAHSA